MKKPEELRSHRWFGREGMRTFNHRSRMAQIGWNEAEYRGKPVIAILNSYAGLAAVAWLAWSLIRQAGTRGRKPARAGRP